MKSFLFVSAFAMLVIAGFTLSGCHKGQNIHPCAPACQITKVMGDLGRNGEHSFDIIYNNKGNPVSMLRSNVGIGRPNFVFRYDHKGRLTDFYGVYSAPGQPDPSSSYEAWHKYYYDAKNRIILDSTFDFGTIGSDNEPIPNTIRYPNGVMNISTYVYDSQNRIIKSTDTQGSNTTIRTLLYTYNNAGNLESVLDPSVEPGSMPQYFFDNKINYHRLNGIWQFLDRDYSVNNPMPADTYNSYGLPIVINLPSHYTGYFVTTNFSHAEFEYSCK
ncbi:YD repeat-containing protein [Chitinophaga sp. CF118]|uniref:hypothetical protein n=1 Tax=Chitinophaga sp. CF118 TaxID=1884367 RepID=UPI0008E008B1|nr:hypothetical protein [Chitinophaga sp. CF118]SFD98767.1 YD repeat-containing protein [Chitinophaga sp. CF118]